MNWNGFLSTTVLLHAKWNATLKVLKWRFGSNGWSANPFHICDILSIHVWGWSLSLMVEVLTQGVRETAAPIQNRMTVLSNCISILSFSLRFYILPYVLYIDKESVLVHLCVCVLTLIVSFIFFQVSHSFSCFFSYYAISFKRHFYVLIKSTQRCHAYIYLGIILC